MRRDSWHNPSDERIAEILRSARTIAVVGCSPKPDRTSHRIARFLLDRGYRMIPVHPQASEILGQRCYPNLAAIPQDQVGRIDIVNLFRKSEDTPPIAEAAVAIGAGCLWLQQGIASSESWRIATEAGLDCVMDRCIAVMHRLLLR